MSSYFLRSCSIFSCGSIITEVDTSWLSDAIKYAIYFDTSKLDKYGVLSNRKVEDQKAGARVEFDEHKKNISDFAIWIKAPENHIMKWDTTLFSRKHLKSRIIEF